ncbi:AbrB/MazE/SpoVT family DNA-binding domain-containing protein [Aurantimonas marina]|uniref:AbrB/MazE/SpoVT family DNA-binding domain-containing protein n=1 Tax=Aurantimonas marina TaxID=2780508 RepID=UPI0019D1E4D0|nr:AbrB/MazE/SpoVT family DNA-binding domain-containing protein [Aurantimonas marina]
MEIRLVQIGNSRGLRLPKSVIDAVGLTDRADLAIEDGALVIRPRSQSSRNGWTGAFGERGGDIPEEDAAWLEADLEGDDAD